MEPTVFDEVRTGTFRMLFQPQQRTSGKEVAATVDLDRLRQLADNCTGLHDIKIFDAFGGSARSALGCSMLERLSVDSV